MANRFIQQLFPKDLPHGLRLLNTVILLPILAWPFVFFLSIFLFDQPREDYLPVYLAFFAINAYPLYLMAIAYFNIRLLRKNRFLGAILPAAFLLAIGTAAAYLFLQETIDQYKSRKAEINRKKQGYLGMQEDFRIVGNKVYYYDSLLIGADARTFKILDWGWQCDKNAYYYKGKKLGYVDRESLSILNALYAKDKSNVYYLGEIIPGADAKSFTIKFRTRDARDANHCYRSGVKRDCKELEESKW